MVPSYTGVCFGTPKRAPHELENSVLSKSIIFGAAAASFLSLILVDVSRANNEKSHLDDVEQLQALRLASVSLVEAIAIAESETGALAVSVEFEEDNGGFVFEVEPLSDDGLESEVVIDPMTGGIIELDIDE